jgi:hypothetical protein
MGAPKVASPPPVPPPPPAAPQLSSTQVTSSGKAYQASQAAARGFGSTILTSGQGADANTSYATKTLLGG